MTKQELERDFKILKSQKFITDFSIEGNKYKDEKYTAYYTDYHGTPHETTFYCCDTDEDVCDYIRYSVIDRRN